MLNAIQGSAHPTKQGSGSRRPGLAHTSLFADACALAAAFLLCVQRNSELQVNMLHAAPLLDTLQSNSGGRTL